VINLQLLAITNANVSSPIPGATIINPDGSESKVPDIIEQDGNTIVELVSSEENESDFDQQQYESVKNLVMRKTVQADELNSQISELSDSLKNILINDSELAQSEEDAKKAKKAAVARKATLMNSPEAVSVKIKLQEAKEDLKDIEDSLSTQLLSLYQITGVQEFETDEGEVREFVIKARVKSKKKK